MMPQDIAAVMGSGEVIEDYRPDGDECLMLGYTANDNLPLHVAVNFEDWESGACEDVLCPTDRPMDQRPHSEMR